MCGKKLKRRWKLLAVCLFLLAFSLPGYSQAENSQPSDPVAEFLALADQIAQKYPGAKPLLVKMGDALQVISDKSKKVENDLKKQSKDLTKQVSDLNSQITTLENSQKDYEESGRTERLGLITDLGNAQTSATIGWTIAGIGWLGDIIQIVLHGLKLW